MVESRHLTVAFPELRITTAADSEEAVTALKKNAPDLVILDCIIPGDDCFGLFKKITTMAPNAAIIISSAQPPAGLRKKKISERIFGVIVKPFEIEELEDIVRRALLSKGHKLVVQRSDTRRERPPIVQYDRHRIINLLSGLLAGLRAFELDLESEIHDPKAIRKTAENYIPRLIDIVCDITRMIKTSPREQADL